MISVHPDGNKTVLAAGANESWNKMAIATICEAIEKAPPGSVHVADFEISTEAVRSAIAAERGLGIARFSIHPLPIGLSKRFWLKLMRSRLTPVKRVN